MNVARAICKLGGSAKALIAVGGPTGTRLMDLLSSEDVPALPVPISGETRQSFAVTDDSTGAQYRFSVPGPIMTAHDAELLLAEITAHTTHDSYLVLSGGVAPGLSVDFPSQIVDAVAAKAPKVIVDTSYAALTQLITHPTVPIHLLRIDQAAAEQAASHPMLTVADSVSFAADLVARGVAKTVVTGRGAEGSVLVSQDARFICHSPVVTVRSKIGAGDAFVGSMTLALVRGARPEQALRNGVAAASATVSTEGTALCEAERVEELRGECLIEQI